MKSCTEEKSLGKESKLGSTGIISAKERERPDKMEIMKQRRKISKEGALEL